MADNNASVLAPMPGVVTGEGDTPHLSGNIVDVYRRLGYTLIVADDYDALAISITDDESNERAAFENASIENWRGDE